MERQSLLSDNSKEEMNGFINNLVSKVIRHMQENS